MPNATDKRAVFFADLDGTLIYSHRHSYDGVTEWIEHLDGKRRAYIPKRAFEAFKKLDFEIVPVTSRNPKQLSRLKDFLKELKVRRILLNNGSLLINIDGTKDDKAELFNSAVKKECEPYASVMEEAYRALSGISGIRNVYSDLPCFISAAHDNPGKVADRLRGELAGRGFNIHSDNHRAYISPTSLTKGYGVKLFCRIFNINYMICAGDSENDISMLKEADLCFFPENLAERFEPKGERICLSGFFADGIAESLLKFEQASLN